MPRLPLLLALLALPGSAARAQDSLLVDATISELVSGGRWEADGRSGFYRVIIRTSHASSNLTVEWLADPRGSAAPGLVRSLEVDALRGAGRLERPRIGQYLKGWRVWLQATSGEPAKPTQRSIDLGPPGELKLVPSLGS
ncbi:MAG TPA: hypothetical protein VL241_06660 [Gemmatimonadales bacterium]|nr:hypothetical protein [Gemmatimonadales bacterium]